jgi:uncharacterized membrane protein
MSNSSTPETRRRIISIDALRGFVMAIMLLDHVRETIYLHMQVGDPVDVSTTQPLLACMRLASSFCAPAFVFLAGISAYLYQSRSSRSITSRFLLTRGLFLIVIEMLVIGFAWTGVFPPEKFYLQIIWCIGICMVCLSGLIYLPRAWQIAICLGLVIGHNLLDGIQLAVNHPLHMLWAILHQRDWIEIVGIPARTSYPMLPWIGVILGGYCIGSWFAEYNAVGRMRRLSRLSLIMLGSFLLIRAANFYGDSPWVLHDSVGTTVMGFFALTKYPASFLFLAFTLSFAGLALILFERLETKIVVRRLAEFGSGAMFFYIMHLYILKAIYISLVAIFGLNHGDYYGVNHPVWVIVWTLALSLPLGAITIYFVRFKERHRNLKWLSYI